MRTTQGTLADKTQYLQETDFHDPGLFQTRYSSKRTAANPGFRPRDHHDL